VDRFLNAIILKNPYFQSKNDHDDYLEWETKVNWIFFYWNRYFEHKKVKLVVIEFTEYALIWWDQIVISGRRNEDLFRLAGR
jgi:hypoxanthine phosphoribosyltransferase